MDSKTEDGFYGKCQDKQHIIPETDSAPPCLLLFGTADYIMLSCVTLIHLNYCSFQLETDRGLH